MQTDGETVGEKGLALGGLSPRTIASGIAVVAVVLVLIIFAVTRLNSDDQPGSNQNVIETEAAAGLTAFQAGDFPEAIAILEKNNKADQANAPALMLLGQSYEATGELGQAVVAYQTSLGLRSAI